MQALPSAWRLAMVVVILPQSLLTFELIHILTCLRCSYFMVLAKNRYAPAHKGSRPYITRTHAQNFVSTRELAGNLAVDGNAKNFQKLRKG